MDKTNKYLKNKIFVYYLYKKTDLKKVFSYKP